MFDLVVEPLARLWGPRLSGYRPDGVLRAALGIEAFALAASGKLLGAPVGFTGCFEPEIRIDEAWIVRVCGRSVTHTCSTNVAPVGAVLAHVALSIAARVDDHLGVEVGNCPLEVF